MGKRLHLLLTVIFVFVLGSNFAVGGTIGGKQSLKKHVSATAKKHISPDPGDNISTPNNALGICPGGNITLTANILSGPVTSYQWTKNGADIAGATGSTYTTNTPGTYNVRVVTSGAPFTVTDVVIVAGSKPVATFTFTNNATCSGTPVTFTPNVTAGTAPFAYSWDFGDTGTSNAATPTHNYTAVGCTSTNFNVKLTVTDANGCSSTVFSNVVNVIDAPDVQVKDAAVFNPFSNCNNNPTAANPNYTLKINNNSPSSACIASYSIDWGDGTTLANFAATSFPLTHTYTQIGAFNLVISALGTNGCQGSKTYIVANQSNPAGGLGTLGQTTGLCAPATIPFVISNWQLNSAGTKYVLNFGDGTSMTMTHPLNPGATADTVYHTYLKSACPSSAFQATLNVINACATTPFTAGNIQINTKPTSVFTPTNVCDGSPVCFTNSTVPGAYGATCDNTTVYSWDFGEPSSGAANTSDQQAPCHTYAGPGTYTVTLSSSNPCGADVVTHTVVVYPLPVMTSPNTATICSGSAFSIPLTASLPSTFKWKATNNPNTTGESTATQSSSTLGNTITITNPLNPAQTVIYTVTPTVIATGCVGSPQTVTVTVNPLPQAPSVTTFFTYCLNDVAPQLTANVTGTNTTTWYDPTNGASSTFPNTGPTATAPTPSTSTAGTTNYWVTQTSADGCLSPVSKIQVIVYPLIANNTVSASQAVCYNTAPSTFTVSTPTGGAGAGSYSYQWQVSTDNGTTFNNITGATNPNYNPGALTASAQYRRIVTSGGCSNTSVAITMTVQPQILGFDVTGPDQTICSGTIPATITGQTATGGNGTLAYQWQSSPDGTTYTNTTGANGVDYAPPSLTATKYYHRITTSVGICPVTSAPVKITVNPIPAINAISDVYYCNGSSTTTITFSSNTAAANTSYTWTNDNTAIGLNQTTGTTSSIASFNTTNSTKLPLTANLTATPTYTGNAVGCPGSTTSFKIIVLPTITISTIADQTVCTGATIAAITPTNDADVSQGTVAYTWAVSVSGGSGAFGLSTNNTPQATIPGFTAVNSGTTTRVATITVTPQYTYNGHTCAGTPTSYKITVYAQPTTATIGTTPDKTCNTTYTLTGDTPIVGTGNWTVTTGPAVVFTPASAGNAVVSALTKGTHYVFSWTISNGNCAANSAPMTLDVLTDITNTIQSDVPSICPTQTANLSTNVLNGGDVPATVTASYSYLWEQSPNGTTGWTTIAGQTSATLAVSPTVTTYYRRTVKSYNLCPVVSNVVSIVVNATAPVANAGSTVNVCSQTFATLAGNNPGAGFTGTWSDTAPGSTLTFSPDAHTYNATVNGIVPGQSYTLTWAIASSSCGLTTSNVTVNDLAPVVSSITPAVTTICAGQSATVTGVAPTGGTGTYTYSWQSSPDNATWSTIPGQSGANLTFSPPATIYVRRVVFSGVCSTPTASVQIIVQQSIANNVISADQQLCTGTAVAALTGTTPTGGDGVYSYQWQQSSDNVTFTDISGATFPGYQPGNAVQLTYFRRIVTTVLCTGPQKSTSNPVKISISPAAIADYAASNQVGCVPFVLGTVITPVGHPAVDAGYQWFANGVSIGTGLAFPGYTINTDGQTVVIKLVATSLFGCDTISISKSFSTTKTVVAAFTKDQIKGCGPLLVHFTNTSAPLVGANYSWNFGNGTTSNLVQPNPVTFLPHPLGRDTTYIVKLTATTTCSVTTYIDSVTVRSAPRAIFTPDKTIGCSPFKINISNQSRGTPNTYTFTFGNGDQVIKTNNNTFSYTYSTTKTDTLTLKMVAENECGKDSASYQIVVYAATAQANLVVSGNNKTGCAPYTVKFDNNSTGANIFDWDFADGVTYHSTQVPETVYHTFNQAGTYNVTLTASNGCSIVTATQTIVVLAHPPVSFTVGALQYCVRDSAVFTNTTNLPTSFSYIWNFGDGATSTLFSPKHPYALPGTYTVTLTAVQSLANGATCQSVTTHTVNIIGIPVAAFTTNSAPLNCAPYNLSVTSTGTNTSGASWDFGDPTSSSNTATGNTATHTYTKAGIYKIKLTAYNTTSCLDSTSTLVRVTETPKPQFTPGDSTICGTSKTVTFTNKTTYGGSDPVNYKWYVNNVFTSNLKNFTYSFTTPTGATLPYTYTIKLITYSTIGCADSISHTLQFNPLPVAAYTVPTHLSCAPFQLVITNNSVYADQYQWYLNGALVSNAQTPVGIVLRAGGSTNTLQLVTSNIYACTTSTVTQTFSTYPKPTAAFSLLDTMSCNGRLDVVVTNKSTGAISYGWDFGDGTNLPQSATAVPTHTYGVPGVYVMKLIAYNGTCYDTASHIIHIANPPKAAFSANILTGCTTISPTFINTSANASNYLWDFGDGTFSTAKNPTHAFTYNGSPYTVKLVVHGEYGCADSVTIGAYITVTAPPVVDFSAQPDSVIKIPNHTFTFKDQTTGGAVKYAWTFGDGKTSVEQNPIHAYADIGTYKVTLTETNAAGCPASRTRTVQVSPVPQYLFVPNAFEPGSQKSELQKFMVRGTGMIAFTMKIFDKWGILIYQTSALDSSGAPTEGWDGMMFGKPAPLGVYVWDIYALFLDGTEWKGMQYPNTGSPAKTGIIHLIR